MSFKGSQSVVELPISRNWTKNGWNITRKFKGTPAAILAKTTELQYDGCTITHTPPDTGGWETIECNYAWDPTDPQSQNPEQPIADTWSLNGNQLERQLWEHPKVVAELNKIQSDYGASAAQQVGFIRKYIKALIDGEYRIVYPFDPLHGETGTVAKAGEEIEVNSQNLDLMLKPTTIDLNVIYGLINSMSKGVEAYPVSQYVLRRQTTIGPFCNIRPNYLNVGKVYTSGALKNTEVIPDTARIVLPEGVWLKQTPTLEQTGPGKWQITQEWWHADYYDSFIYEPAR